MRSSICSMKIFLNLIERAEMFSAYHSFCSHRHCRWDINWLSPDGKKHLWEKNIYVLLFFVGNGISCLCKWFGKRELVCSMKIFLTLIERTEMFSVYHSFGSHRHCRQDNYSWSPDGKKHFGANNIFLLRFCVGNAIWCLCNCFARRQLVRYNRSVLFSEYDPFICHQHYFSGLWSDLLNIPNDNKLNMFQGKVISISFVCYRHRAVFFYIWAKSVPSRLCLIGLQRS